MRFLAAVVIAACALPAVAAPAPEAASGMSARLRKLGGGAPVYLVLGAKGVEARTADGKARRVVFEGTLDDALWDAQGEVLLLRRGDRVEALDLREARPKPRLLATGVPPGRLTWEFQDRYLNSVRQGPESIRLGPDHRGVVGIAGAPGPLETDEASIAAFEQAMARAALVDGDALAELGARALLPIPAPVYFDRARKLALPADVSCTDDADYAMCGGYVELGPWLLTVESVSCGDACWTGCRLYDPASRLPLAADPRRAAPASLAEAGSCGPYHVDASGRWYLFQEFATPVLCAFGGACAKVEGWPLGWLDPALVVGAEL
ncbi:MAG: hypothetical protein V4850_25615 [Myxococcota bacterium]